jgi:cytochrome P450
VDQSRAWEDVQTGERSEGEPALAGRRIAIRVELREKGEQPTTPALRSSRLHLLIPAARQVIAREGVTLAGMHIPYGCVVGAPAWTIQRDPAIYSAGTEFDPFRFSRPREQLEASGREAGEGDPDGDARGARFSMTTTKDDFLVWGHGRHAW